MPSSPTPLDHLLAIVRNPAQPWDPALQPAVWKAVKKQATIHGFTGLLANNAAAWLPSSERPWHDRVLTDHYRRYKARMALLCSLIQACDAEGIPCVSLKGPLFGERFCPAPFLKKSGDLDLLIGEADIGRAARLMQRLGGRISGRDPWRVHSRWSHHVTFIFGPQESTTPVEIHSRLSMAGVQSIPSEAFVDRSVKWNSAEGFTANVLSPADEAFYLAVHAASHCFHRLRWLYDAILTARLLDDRGNEQVRELVRRYRQAGRYIPAATAAKEFFGNVLSPDCSDLPRSWLCGFMTPNHIRGMISRPQGIRLTAAQRLAYLFDWCCMTDSLWGAVQVSARWTGYRASQLYLLAVRAQGPDALARTIPG